MVGTGEWRIATGASVTRDAQLAALASRAKCYSEAAGASYDPAIIRGFQEASCDLLEQRKKMEEDPEYQLSPRIQRELGFHDY